MGNASKAKLYFAAANGASGFRSYFDEIFPSESYTAIFILKGGPGTGKSTLLKKLSRRFERADIEQEIFLCSSDPKSLDGLTLTKGEKRVAILDGTAPHERDARIPGAADILINLGEGFELSRLRAQREKILTLQKKKSIFYKDAYFYLGLFGIFKSKIMAETKKRLRRDAVLQWIKEASFSENANNLHTFSPRLLASFSREGIKRLDTYETCAERNFFINGEREEGEILLTAFFSELNKRDISGYFSPSPFFSEVVDGLYLKNDSLSISTAPCTGATEVCTEDFFEKPSNNAMKKCAEYQAEAHRYLSLAKDALSHASENHFALEEIYTPAMRFERIDTIVNALEKEIGELLSIR